jgi:hypothetical protein
MSSCHSIPLSADVLASTAPLFECRTTTVACKGVCRPHVVVDWGYCL